MDKINVTFKNQVESFDYNLVVSRLMGTLKMNSINQVTKVILSEDVYFIKRFQNNLMYFIVDTLGILEEDCPITVVCVKDDCTILKFMIEYSRGSENLGFFSRRL